MFLFLLLLFIQYTFVRIRLAVKKKTNFIFIFIILFAIFSRILHRAPPLPLPLHHPHVNLPATTDQGRYLYLVQGSATKKVVKKLVRVRSKVQVVHRILLRFFFVTVRDVCIRKLTNGRVHEVGFRCMIIGDNVVSVDEDKLERCRGLEWKENGLKITSRAYFK